jgi:hypothetical protein
MSSFRGDAQHRTRNLEIPGSPFGRPGMTRLDGIDHVDEGLGCNRPLDDGPAREDVLLAA